MLRRVPLVSRTPRGFCAVGVEASYELNPLDPSNDFEITDADGGDLLGVGERLADTNPNNPDADDKGLSDGFEVGNGFDQLVANGDDDGLRDGADVAFCTDPLLVDTDGDGLKDGAELQGSAEPPRADSDGDRDQ